MELGCFRMFDRTCTRGRFTASEAAIKYNARVKFYPDGAIEVAAAERALFRESGWEGRGGGADPLDEQREAGDPEASLQRSRRRARAAIADLAYSNDFRYFVTFTLDAAKVNRYDVREVTRKLTYWLDNRVRRVGLRYVLVPELHKDGAVHFHGLINDVLPVVDSGTVVRATGGKPRKPRSEAERRRWLAEGGHVVYNLPAWGLGFSTAIELYGSRQATIAYVCKYVTKSTGKVGGRWYYSGGHLDRPAVVCADIPYQAAAACGVPFVIDELACSMVKFRVEKEGACDVLRSLDNRQ